MKQYVIIGCFVVLGLIGVGGQVFGGMSFQEEKEKGKIVSPYFVVETQEAGDAFPLKVTTVSANVNGVIADVIVRQTYANDGTVPLNAQYVFPASTHVAVHGMKMKIGDDVVVAKIKKRDQAKKEFTKAKAEGKSASLLSQNRPNVFTMKVANVMPGDHVDVELRYTELLLPTAGTYQFVYPTVVGPRYSNQRASEFPESDQWVKSPYLKEGTEPRTTFDLKVMLSTGLALQEVASSTHDVNVAWSDQTMATVSLADPKTFEGNRDFILKYRLGGQQIQSGLSLFEGKDENFFLLMMQPPEWVELKDISPREYIFVLDVSGSMFGFPLNTAKTVMKDLIGRLRDTDKFNVVLFAGASQVMAPTSHQATQKNVQDAIRWIEVTQGGGGTEIVPALQRALALPRDEHVSRTVVIVTDGYIDAESKVFEIIQNNLNTTNFFSFGIGSSVNRYLIEGMARAGRGEPFVVTVPAEAGSAAKRFREYVSSPVLTNIQVQSKGFEIYDIEPPSIPDLLAERPIVVFGKWRGARVGSIEVSGKSAQGHYRKVVKVSEIKPRQENSALPYLWARSSIMRLSDLAFGNENPELVSEITSLGLTYSLLTKYTSFIAVLEKIRNPSGHAINRAHPVSLGQGVSNYAVASEPALWVLLAFIVLFALARKRKWTWRC
tara:strand:+ start:3958 stop:5946 length:1989 start_codon:yes stop_codon:yes gene_type:complete